MSKSLIFDKNILPSDSALANAKSPVYYNGFNFPPSLRSRAEVTPVYDSSDRVLKYLKITLRVEFYLFLGTSTGDKPFHHNDFDRNDYTPHRRPITSPLYTTDEEMDNLRLRLLEPGQPLCFSVQGLGTLRIFNREEGEVVDYPPFDLDKSIRDCNFGPKPRLLSWRPLTNKCAFISWEVETCVPPCGRYESPTNQESPLAINGNISEFSYAVEFTIDNRGLTVRTIRGRVEVALSRESLTEPNTHAGDTLPFDFREIRSAIISFFPILPGFLRDQNYSVEASKNVVNFTLTDTEINSDEAYGEGCVDERVTLSANNIRERVFSAYNVTLSGSITLAAGYPKPYAYREISRLFHKFYTVSKDKGVFPLSNDNSSPVLEGELSSPAGSRPSKAFLTRYSITDHIFDRTVDFTISWFLCTSLETLFAATGMFRPVREPNQQGLAWKSWATSLGVFLNEGGLQNLSLSHHDDVIISICQQAEVPPRVVDFPPGPLPSEDGSPSHDVVLPEDSYVLFEPRFHLEIDEHSSQHSPLGDYQSPVEVSRDATMARYEHEFVPHAPASPDPYQTVFVHNRRQPTYRLRFYGMAVRVNYPVPEPHVTSYGGQSVRRVGKTVLKPYFLGKGVDLDDGKSHKLFGLLWSKTYVLPNFPDSSRILTDAHKNLFTGV